MTSDRRAFLVRSGAALAALGTTVDASAAVDPSTWDGVRAAFPLTRARVHLAAFLLAAHPHPVAEAIERHRRGLDADTVVYLRENEGRLEEAARAAAADYLGTSPELVALTDSTTMGLGLLYGGLRLRPGDEVVTSEHDFYATHEALRLRAAATGARVRRIRLYGDPAKASAEAIVGAVARAVGPRTRAVALTWVHSSTGVKLPIRRIAQAIETRRKDVLLCVDGVHGFGVEDVDVSRLGCDLFASGCHKWLFGPRGTGVLWGTDAAWRRVAATIPTFDGASYGAWLQGRPPAGLSPGARLTPGGFHSFEHRWALAAAFAFHNSIGRARIAARTRLLARTAKDGLARVRGVRVVTPMSSELSAGLVCFGVDGLAAGDVVGRLRQRGIVASVTPYATQYVRFGPSIVNSPEEVERAVRAVAEMS